MFKNHIMKLNFKRISKQQILKERNKAYKFFKLNDMKEIKISGVIQVQDMYTENDVLDRFLEFLETRNWYFGGSVHELTEQEIKEAE